MQTRSLHARESVSDDVLNGDTACVDPAHCPVASMGDSSGFVGKAEIGGEEAVGDQFAIAGARDDDIRLPSTIACTRRRTVQQVATMCECSINVHESPAPDCLIDGPFCECDAVYRCNRRDRRGHAVMWSCCTRTRIILCRKRASTKKIRKKFPVARSAVMRASPSDRALTRNNFCSYPML